MKVNTAKSSEEKVSLDIIELLADPVRSRIFFELTMQKTLTTRELLKKIKISKGTMSHHLGKLVSAGVLDVSVQKSGRPIKSYSIKKPKLIIKKEQESIDKITVNRLFIQSSTAQMQMIANVMKDSTSKLLKEKSISKQLSDNPILFQMLLLSSQQIEFVRKKLYNFMLEIEPELRKMKNPQESGENNFLFSTTIFPIL